MRARLRIDRELCVGSGLCEAMSPELFTLADDGLAVLNERRLADLTRLATAQDVADCCPSGAILLERDHDTDQEGAGR
ncbi:ferredoxin [Actinomadura nitritigenes]|uniref:ferredoxin n=1 Tax=Actinomadura nitritigenes TaxID=134602 RepID=UPI0036BAE878